MTLSNIRIATRLRLGFALMSVLVVAMAGVGAYKLKYIGTLNARQTELTALVKLVGSWRLQTELNLTRVNVRLKGGNNSSLNEMLEAPTKATSAQIEQIKAKLGERLTDPSDRQLFDAVGERRSAYIKVRDELFLRLKRGDVAGVEEDTDKLLGPVATQYVDAVDALDAALISANELAAAEQSTASRGALQTLVVLAVLALVAAIALAWVITQSVVAPLHAAIAQSQRVAAGDLTRQGSSSGASGPGNGRGEERGEERGDELGDLMRAQDAMTQQLQQSLRQVLAASESIRGASGEIASGNADLSARTEQAAGSLQQTSGSMQQLSEHLSRNSASSREASQTAGAAASVAQRGGTVVAQVVATMAQIDASSRRIQDIIGTVDGIAFQTNILALNAAVEAARAGEQGRGFAVVASEVRSLAQRSANAAREIKSLIGASVDAISAGSKLVNDAGGTMTEIVANVQRVVEMINAITQATGEQSEKIAEVTAAVSVLDGMIGRNAALVEQSAASAENLNEQAVKLFDLVGAFRLETQR